jgi:hypothetical protein
MRNTSTLLFLINEIETDLKSFQVIGSLGTVKETYFDENPDKNLPPDGLINSLLCYARAMEVKDTESIGKTEWILN